MRRRTSQVKKKRRNMRSVKKERRVTANEGEKKHQPREQIVTAEEAENERDKGKEEEKIRGGGGRQMITWRSKGVEAEKMKG